MNSINEKLEAVDWQLVREDIYQKGYCIIPGLLNPENCLDLIRMYSHTNLYRKTVIMERYRFGLGEYKYFKYPLPGLLQTIREYTYPKIAPIANLWMKALNLENRFPESFQELKDLCHCHNQTHPTVLILRYNKGGYNTLHQDLYGDINFPMQLVLFLNEPEHDYRGGEFVLIEQTPRAQSKAIVLKPKKGDMMVFTTSFRPAKGSKGYYKVNVKHGVSEVFEGERHTLGVIFHDGLS